MNSSVCYILLLISWTLILFTTDSTGCRFLFELVLMVRNIVLFVIFSWLNFVNYKVKCFQQNSTKCMTRIATREGQEVGWKCSQEHLCQLSGKQLKSDNLSVRLSDGGLCSGRWWAVSWYPRSRIVGEGTSPESRPPIIVAWTASFFLHQSWGPPWGLFYFKYFWLKTLNSPQIDHFLHSTFEVATSNVPSFYISS